MRPGGILLALLSALLGAAPLHAATYYVAPSGSDSPGCGTAQSPATPRRTIQAGLSCLAPGDTLYLRAGTYVESLVDPPSGSSDSARVTIAGYPGETVTLRPATDGAILLEAAAFVTIDNLHVDCTNCTQGMVRIGASGGHDITVQQSELFNLGPRDPGGQGILVRGGGGHRFLTLHIHHVGTSHLTHGIYHKGHDSVIQGCDIHDIAGFGIHLYWMESGQTGVDNNLVIGNYVHDTGQAGDTPYMIGILLSSGNQNAAINNVVVNGGTGILVDGNSANAVLNNTIVNNRRGDGACVYFRAGSGHVARNNVCWNNAQGIMGAGYMESTTLLTDPLFVNASAGDFRLRTGSPAIDAGLTLPQVPTDRAGTPRPQGRATDLGAYEAGGSAPAQGIPAPRNLRVTGIP